MSEIVTINDATLYHGDCFEVMPRLAGVHAVITDPPFNAGKDIENDDMSGADWTYFCTRLAAATRTLAPDNVLLEVGKNDTEMRAAFDRLFRYRWAIALNYTNAMRNGAVGYANFGLVLWYGAKCYERFMDRIDAPLDSTLSQFKHPCPKEPRHYERLVSMFTLPGQTVLDPFMGSGTTGIGCANLGRNFIGVESDRQHFDTACARIESTYAQQRLFA